MTQISYDACTDNEKHNQKVEVFDSGYKAWSICAISATVNMVLYGIIACQGIHLLASHLKLLHRSRIPGKSNKIVGRNLLHSIQVYTHVHRFPLRLTPVKGPPNLCSKKPVPT